MQTTSFLRWAKLHKPVRFDLTASGVPHVRPRELGMPVSVALEVKGAHGDPDLIDTVAKLYGVDPAGIVPVPGTSTANLIALALGASHGLSVLLEEPGYEPLRRAGSFPGLKVVPTARRYDRGFAVDFAEIDAELRHGAVALTITNLHNPTGAMMSAETVTELASLCARENATLIVDEVYLDAAALIGGGSRWTAAALGDNVVATGSLTKVYGLGGLRVGWIMASEETAGRARDLMDLLSVDLAAPASSLAILAFSKLGAMEARYRGFHSAGHSVFRCWMEKETLVQGYSNHGALFEWLRLPRGVTGVRLNEVLVSDYDTQAVPGSFFGADDHIRLSIAVPAPDLREALSRISEALTKLVDGG